MENEKPLNENKVEEQKIITGGQAENNSQKELPKEPIVLSPAPLTIETAGGVDNLYEAWLKGKKVELPPWLIEKGKDDDKRIEVDTQKLFRYIKKNENIKSVKLGNSKGIILHHYENGYFKEWTESDCKAFIKSYIPVDIRKSAYWEAVYRELTTEYADTDESQFNSNEDIINFRNGILNIVTGEFLPHSPEYLCTIQIPCDYKPNLSLAQAPYSMEFFNSLTNHNYDDMCTIFEVLGLVISNVSCPRFKQLLILLGAGNTGKSVLRELAIKLVGRENCHTIDIEQLNRPFGTGGIYGKRLIGSGDMKVTKLKDIEKLKELTGNDYINMELKYQNSFSAKFYGFIWYNTNELPLFQGDKGQHVYDRFLIVSCDNVIPPEKRNPQLLDKLYEEREVIVSVAIKFLQDAIKRDYKFTESDKTKQNRINYQIKNDSLTLFLKDCCNIFTGRTRTSEFKFQYKKWCIDNNFIPEKPNDISKILTEEFGINKIKSDVEFYELEFKKEFQKYY